MKKLISLLSVLTISGTTVPTTIAASIYEKEKEINKQNNISQTKYEAENNNEESTLSYSETNSYSWLDFAYALGLITIKNYLNYLNNYEKKDNNVDIKFEKKYIDSFVPTNIGNSELSSFVLLETEDNSFIILLKTKDNKQFQFLAKDNNKLLNFIHWNYENGGGEIWNFNNENKKIYNEKGTFIGEGKPLKLIFS